MVDIFRRFERIEARIEKIEQHLEDEDEAAAGVAKLAFGETPELHDQIEVPLAFEAPWQDIKTAPTEPGRRVLLAFYQADPARWLYISAVRRFPNADTAWCMDDADAIVLEDSARCWMPIPEPR